MRPTAPTSFTVGLALAAMLCTACKDDAPAQQAAEAAPAQPASPSEAAATPQSAGATALLQWLDPEAIAVAYAKLPDGLDPEGFGTVFALPPRVDRLLRDAHDVLEGLDAVRARGSDPAASFFEPAALAYQPQIATRPYVVRSLARSRDELDRLLTDAGFTKSHAQGYDIYEPKGAYPWKLAVLDERTVAFFSTKEIGFGLGPLTAGRDLPASQLEEELAKVLTADPGLALAVFASGPLLHFDLAADIVSWQIAARAWQKQGLDVELALVPADDVQAAVATLEGRTAEFENEQVRKLVDRVAYSAEGDAVVGRLQLTPDDIGVLSR